MNNLLEYTRLLFDERFTRKGTKFRCIKEQVKNGFCRCICIPGIAMNFCTILAGYCYEDVEFKEEIQWDPKYKTYLPYCTYSDKKITPIFTDEKVKADEYFPDFIPDDLCAEGLNVFAYVKARGAEALKKYKKENDENSFCKETLLAAKEESFSNSVDYFRLFLSIAETYRGEYEPDIFAEHLFRLLLFLMPYTAMRIVERNLNEQEGNEEFCDYNIKLLKEYRELGKDAQNCDIVETRNVGDTFNHIKDFMGFDFEIVFDNYNGERGKHARQELLELIKKQSDICSKRGKYIDGLIRKIEEAGVRSRA